MIMSDVIRDRIQEFEYAGHRPDRIAMTNNIYDTLLAEVQRQGQRWPNNLNEGVERLFQLPITLHARPNMDITDPLSQTREVFSIQSADGHRLDTTISDEFLAVLGGWPVAFGDRILTKPNKSIHARWGKNR